MQVAVSAMCAPCYRGTAPPGSEPWNLRNVGKPSRALPEHLSKTKEVHESRRHMLMLTGRKLAGKKSDSVTLLLGSNSTLYTYLYIRAETAKVGQMLRTVRC